MYWSIANIAPSATHKYSTHPLKFQPFDQVQAGEGERREQAPISCLFCCLLCMIYWWHLASASDQHEEQWRRREGEAEVIEGCKLGQKWGKSQAFIMWPRKEQHTCLAADQTSTFTLLPRLPFCLPLFLTRKKKRTSAHWTCTLLSGDIQKGCLDEWYFIQRNKGRDSAAWTEGHWSASPVVSSSLHHLPLLSIRASLMQLLALGVLPIIRSSPLARLFSHRK